MIIFIIINYLKYLDMYLSNILREQSLKQLIGWQ